MPLVSLLTLLACSDRQPSITRGPTPLETAIASDLSARFSTQVNVSCDVIVLYTIGCTAKLADGTELPIAIEHGKTEYGWRVDGIVIDSKAIVSYVQDGLAAVHVTQAVDCGPPVQVIKRGALIVCKLAGGGAAFVALAADGQASLELELDPAAAAARSELQSSDKDRELTTQSSELESLAGETDGEEEVVTDAGVP